MAVAPPKRKLRVDRLVLVVLVLAGLGAGGYLLFGR
jgi:hypothetical protein